MTAFDLGCRRPDYLGFGPLKPAHLEAAFNPNNAAWDVISGILSSGSVLVDSVHATRGITDFWTLDEDSQERVTDAEDYLLRYGRAIIWETMDDLGVEWWPEIGEEEHDVAEEAFQKGLKFAVLACSEVKLI